MNNKDRYKRTFSSVHTSMDYSKEVFEMNNKSKRIHLSRPLAACLVACLLLGTAGICYGNDVGGIQRQLQLWIDGDQTAAVIEFNGAGEYALSYKDSDGNLYSETGGGVKFDKDGNEIPATEEELLRQMFYPDVEYEDGKAILYYYNQVEGNYYKHSLDITDLFVDDVCYITLTQEGKPMYITVKYQKGLATNTRRYLNPSEFNNY